MITDQKNWAAAFICSECSAARAMAVKHVTPPGEEPEYSTLLLK